MSGQRWSIQCVFGWCMCVAVFLLLTSFFYYFIFVCFVVIIVDIFQPMPLGCDNNYKNFHTKRHIYAHYLFLRVMFMFAGYIAAQYRLHWEDDGQRQQQRWRRWRRCTLKTIEKRTILQFTSGKWQTTEPTVLYKVFKQTKLAKQIENIGMHTYIYIRHNIFRYDNANALSFSLFGCFSLDFAMFIFEKSDKQFLPKYLSIPIRMAYSFYALKSHRVFISLTYSMYCSTNTIHGYPKNVV